MKTSFKAIFAVALAATVTFASCSKENSGTNNGDQAEFLVRITTPTDLTSRTIGETSKDVPLTLVGGKILFSGEDGTITRVVEVVANDVVPTSAQVKLSDLASGAVIQHINESTKTVTFIGGHNADFTALPASLVDADIADVKAAAFSIASIADGSDAVVSNVPIYGADTELVVSGSAPNKIITADFQVKAIGSRIQIKAITGAPTSVKSFNLEGIWINNYLPSMAYAVAPAYSTIVNNGSTKANYPAVAGDYSAPVLADVDANLFTDKVGDNKYVAGTDKFWVYNVFPNTGLGKTYLPHIVIKVTDLVDVGGTNHGEKYLTVKGYNGDTKGDIKEFEGGYSYTFGGEHGLVFEIDDVKEYPEEGVITGNVKIEAMSWVDELVTPEF